MASSAPSSRLLHQSTGLPNPSWAGLLSYHSLGCPEPSIPGLSPTTGSLVLHSSPTPGGSRRGAGGGVTQGLCCTCIDPGPLGGFQKPCPIPSLPTLKPLQCSLLILSCPLGPSWLLPQLISKHHSRPHPHPRELTSSCQLALATGDFPSYFGAPPTSRGPSSWDPDE